MLTMGEVSVFLSHFFYSLIVTLSTEPFSFILWGDIQKISNITKFSYLLVGRINSYAIPRLEMAGIQ